MNIQKKKLLYSSIGVLLFLHIISSTLIELNVIEKPLMFDFAFITLTNLIFLISLLFAIIIELIKLYYQLISSFYKIINIKKLHSTHEIIKNLTHFTLIVLPILFLNYYDFLSIEFIDINTKVLYSIIGLDFILVAFAIILLFLMLAVDIFRKKITFLKLDDNFSNFLIANNIENAFFSIDVFSFELGQENIELEIYIFMVQKNEEITCLISNRKTDFLNTLKKGFCPPSSMSFNK